jgi:hypothetical protein
MMCRHWVIQFKTSNLVNAKNLSISCANRITYRLQMHLKSIGCMETVLFPTVDNCSKYTVAGYW